MKKTHTDNLREGWTITADLLMEWADRWIRISNTVTYSAFTAGMVCVVAVVVMEVCR